MNALDKALVDLMHKHNVYILSYHSRPDFDNVKKPDGNHSEQTDTRIMCLGDGGDKLPHCLYTVSKSEVQTVAEHHEMAKKRRKRKAK